MACFESQCHAHLATTRYRLGELAGTGQLDPEESKSLHRDVGSNLGGTVFRHRMRRAPRDWDTDDSSWDEADNTYSDGRRVMIGIRIEPLEESDSIGDTVIHAGRRRR